MSSLIPRPLDPVEVRVLGALLEKEQATPELYPLTVNALLAACNQKTNREPVMQLTETEVWDALERLRQEVLVWRSEGARAERWKQSVSRRWGLDGGGKAVMTLLLLRGPQTAGELRARSDRLHAFASVAEVEETLRRMAAMAEPLVAEQPRRTGQKETRWTHLVGETPAETVEPERGESAAPARPGLADRVARLEELVAQLTRDLDELRSLLS
ncbi:MAG TPA: YceH family protein [Thermoanaerobaculia bacterium]|nr:YceH family protein [Thermoanaerobaculia bacterium]